MKIAVTELPCFLGILGAFCAFILIGQLKDWTGNRRERERGDHMHRVESNQETLQ